MKKILIYDDYNRTIPNNQDVVGTVRQTFGNASLGNGWKIVEVYDMMTNALAIGRERTAEEKHRNRIYGDKGAKFSKGKQMCVLGDVIGTITTLPTKDNLIVEIYED